MRVIWIECIGNTLYLFVLRYLSLESEDSLYFSGGKAQLHHLVWQYKDGTIWRGLEKNIRPSSSFHLGNSPKFSLDAGDPISLWERYASVSSFLKQRERKIKKKRKSIRD